jgi:hypothetical protein
MPEDCIDNISLSEQSLETAIRELTRVAKGKAREIILGIKKTSSNTTSITGILLERICSAKKSI